VKGTLVGFWYPEYFGVLNVLGLHLHFISDAKDFGGHLLDLRSSKLTAGIDLCSGYEIEIVNTPEFTETVFDLTEGYSNN
jgi:acetolactate decarboxylase